MAVSDYRKKLLAKYSNSKPKTEKPAQKESSQGQKTSSQNTGATDYRKQLLQKYNPSNPYGVSNVNKWISDTGRLTEAMDRNNRINWASYDRAYGSQYSEEATKLKDSYRYVSSWLSQNKSNLKEYDSLERQLSNMYKTLSAMDAQNADRAKYFSQWENEGAYKNFADAMKYGDMTADELKASVEGNTLRMENAMAALDARIQGTVVPREYEEDLAYIADTYGIDVEDNPAYARQLIQENYRQEMGNKNPILYQDENGAVSYDNLMRIKRTNEKIDTILADNRLSRSYNELLSYRDDISQMENAMAAIDARKEGLVSDPANEEALDYILSKYDIDTSSGNDDLIQQEIRNKYLDLISGSYAGQKENQNVLAQRGYDWNELEYYLDWQRDRERSAELQKSYQLAAEQYPGITTVANLFTGPISAAEYMTDVLERLVYSGTDNHSAYKLDNIYDNNASTFSGTVAGTVSENIRESVLENTGNEALGNLASTAYGGITSVAQSLLTQSVFGGTVGSGILASQAASSAYLEGIKNGQSTEQAMLTGVASGMAEYFTEKITWEKLLEIDTSWDVTSVRGFVKSLLKNTSNATVQGLYEAGEEAISAIANRVADDIVAGDKSSIATAIRQYKMEGFSDTDAKNQATQDWFQDLLESALGGFIGGGASAGLVTAIQTGTAAAEGISFNRRENNRYKSIYGQDLYALVDEALEVAPDNELAKQIKAKLESGKKVGGSQIRSLVQSTESNLVERDVDSIQNAAVNRLTELGETGDIDSIALALAKQSAGRTLTDKEQRNLDGSKYGRQVAEELNADNINAGKTGTEWAQRIGTERINADEYSRLVEASQITQEEAGGEGEETVTAAEKTAPKQTKSPETEAYESSEDGKTVLKATGEEVSIEGVNSVKNGRMTLKLADGRVVSSDSISYGSANEAVLYQTVQEIASDSGNASALLNGFSADKNLQTYQRGIRLAHLYGKSNVPLSELSTSRSVSSLPQKVKEAAYKAGQKAGGKEVAKNQAKAKSAAKAYVKGTVMTESGEIFREYEKESGIKLNAQQEAGILAMEKMSAALGVNFYVFESYLNKAGKRVYVNDNGDEVAAPNGYYKDGKVYVDLNAGTTGKGTILFTVAHELTHHIKAKSPAKFRVLANFVAEQFSQHDQSVSELVASQMEKAKRSGRKLSFEDAFEEVVADSMESILTSGNVMQMMAEIQQQDKTLWQMIVDWFKNLVEELKSIVSAYKGVTPDSREGRMVADMQDVIGQIESLYAEALADTAFAEAGVMVDAESQSVAPVSFSEHTWQVDRDLEVDVKYSVHDVDILKSTDYYGFEIEDIRGLLKKGSGIKWNRGNVLKMPITEYKEVYSRISTEYSNFAYHGGIQFIDRTTDGLDADHFLYLFVDHGFDDYEIICRLDYHKQEDLVLFLRRLILNGRSAEGAADNIVRLRDLNKRTDGRRNNNSNRPVRRANDQKNFGRSGQRSGDKRSTGTGDTGGVDEDGNGVKLSSREAQYFPDVLPESVLRHFGYDARPEGELGRDALYQNRSEDSVSNRTLLANAFETVAQNDIEKARLQEYKEKIDLMNAEEKKLQDLNKEIKDLSFAKGPRNTDRINKLRAKATRTGNRIATYDRQLLRLEASKPLQSVLEREKRKAYKRAEEKGKKALQEFRTEFREKVESKQKKIIEKYQESKKRSIENRHKTEMRHKIRKTIWELDSILNRGNKKRNVKQDMRDLVSKAIGSSEVLFLDAYPVDDMIRNGVGVEMTAAEEKMFAEAQEILTSKEYTEEEKKNRLAYRKSKLKDVFERERARLNKTTVSEVLTNLADAYKELENSEYTYVKDAFDINVHDYLLNLKRDVGGTLVRDMSIDQLRELYGAYRMVLYTVRNANSMFAANLKYTRDVLANRVMDEVREAGGERELWSKAQDARNSFFWNNLKPVYAFERIGSETFTELYKNIRKGQDTWAVDLQEADAFRKAVEKKYNKDSWDTEEQFDFKSSSGIEFSLNLEQIMSLYAYSKREQAHDHLLKGGFVFDGNTEVVVSKHGVKRTYLNKSATAYNLSVELLTEITGKLTSEQRAYVDEMQEYLSATMGGKGNEVSMQLYGVNLFGEKYYFPLRSAGQYMEKAKEATMKREQGQVSIVNSGFTKSVAPKASNPVVLSGFKDVWSEHVNDMSMYHSFVLPLEDFRKVYNYSSPNFEGMQSVSVNQVLQNAYGKASTDYLDQLYKDLNGGAISDPRETFAKSLISKFKKASVFASASVVIQQPSAIARAFALINPKYFVGVKIDRKKHRDLWAEVKKYAPVAIIKEMGYFDTNMGRSAKDYLDAREYNGIGEKAKALFTDGDYRDEILSKAPALADELTWCAIWDAVKRETRANNPGMAVTSEEFLQKAGERFSEIVDKTQVYDSILSRSGFMRSKGGLMTMWTSFMGEPTTSINMIEDALRKGKRGGKRYLAKSFGAVFSYVLLNSVLVSLVYGGRDDDEEKTFAEKYLSSFVTEMIDGINPLTYYPFIKDIWSAFQGYDIERADMSLVSKLVSSLTETVQVFSKDTSGMDDAELQKHQASMQNAVWGVIDNISSMAGLPVKNIRRDINGGVNLVKTIGEDLNGRDTTWGSLVDALWDSVKKSIPVVGWFSDETKADKLYQAIVSGDTAYQKRLQSTYKTEESLNSAIRKVLREKDSRVWEAAVAWNNNDLETYMRLAKAIIGEKHFSQDNIVMAIQAEAKAITENREENTSESKAKGYFNAEKFAAAVSQGNTSMADIIREDILQTAQKNGKTEKEAEASFISSAKSSLKELFEQGNISEKNVVDALAAYCDMDSKEASETVAKWEFEGKYGFSYSDRIMQFKEGNITAAELKDMTIAIGGKTAEEAEKDLVDYARDGYMDGYFSRDEANGIMTKDGNLTSSEAESKLRYIDFKLQAPDTYVDDAWVDEYYKEIKSSGITIEAFVDYRNKVKSITGEGKKERRMRVIDSLPITSRQKDALYYAEGWAESTIYEAPWR